MFVFDDTKKKPKITNTSEDPEETNESTETPLNDNTVKWWLPFQCGKVGTLHTGGGQIGMGCGSRACLKCHRKKLIKSLNAIGDLKKYPKSSMYSLVFTPKERVKTHEDVDNFLNDFRAMLRKWQRTHGMNFGYWVAETVVKDDEPPTEIICPIRKGNTPNPTSITDDVFKTCVEGGNCIICKGKGYIPSTHLHIHLVICCDSFYFGEGEIPEYLKDRNYYDFGGDGFYGFVHQFKHLGKFECQIIKDRKTMGRYIAKACLVYLGKGQKGVDWAESQRGCMIASYTYGKRRHRGACGDAYGYQKRTKDYTNFVSFGFHPPDDIQYNSTDAFYGYDIPKKEEKKEDYNGRYIDVMTVGKKAQKTIPPKKWFVNNVLHLTELDTIEENEKFYDFIKKHRVYVWKIIEEKKEFGLLQTSCKVYEAPEVTSPILSNHWKNKQVIKKSDVWFMIDDEDFIFGKGSTMLSIPVEWFYSFYEHDEGGLHYIENLLFKVKHMPYEQWITLLYYPFDVDRERYI